MTQVIELDPLAEEISAWCESMRVVDAPYGTYRLVAGGEPHFYGSADMAITRWALGEDLSTSVGAAQLDEWAAVINGYQNPRDGRFGPFMGHHVLHANGTAVNGLCALGRRLRYPVSFYRLFDTPDRIGAWLSQIDWKMAWPASHLVWGGPVTWQHSAAATPQWRAACLAWFSDQLEESTGGWPKDYRTDTWRTIEPLGCAVHVWPLYRHAGLEVPGLATLTERVLGWQRPTGDWDGINRYGSMDALYVLALAVEQELPRIEDYKRAVNNYLDPLLAAGPATWAPGSGVDVHQALCWVSGLSYARRAVPERFIGGPWGDIFDRPEIYQIDAVLPDDATASPAS